MLAARELAAGAEPHRISRVLPGLRYVFHGCGCAGGPTGPAEWDSLKRCYVYPLSSVPTGIIENIKRDGEAGVSASFRAAGVYRFQQGQ